MRERQGGQVLVIVALLMTAMVGALGLAIDGGRIYVDRRVLQNASDASSLGAADAYGSTFRGGAAPSCTAITSGSAAVTNAYTAALDEFADQVNQAPASFSASGSDPTITYTDSAAGYSFVVTREVPTTSVDPAACAFKVTATHNLPMFFIQVINQIGTQTISVASQAVSAQNLIVPGALLFLLDPSNVSAPGQDLCGSGSPNDTLSPAGTGSLTIDGSMVTDGNMQMWTSNSYSMTMNNGGGIFDHCDLALSGKPTTNITWNPDNVTKFHGHTTYIDDPFGKFGIDWCGTDSVCTGTANAGTSTTWLPNMDKAPYTTASPTAVSTSATSPAELEPGLYSLDPGFSNVKGNPGCWFVEPGIYQWQAGLRTTSGSGLVSNELLPPSGETAPSTGNSQNFNWAGGGIGSGSSPGATGCEGSVAQHPTACVASCPGKLGTTYYIRVAAVRAEAAPPGGTTACSQQPTVLGNGAIAATACWRQSYLSSTCLSFTSAGSTAGFTYQIGISNVPGMGNATQLQTSDTHDRLLDSRYDIFASTTGCGDTEKWGYVTSAFFNCSSGANLIEPNSAAAGCTGMNTGTQTPVCTAASTISYATANHFESDGSCGLGYVVSTTINSSDLPAGFNPSGTACTIGTAPTAGAACAPWYTGGTLCTGQTSCDAANDDYCLSGSGTGYCQILLPSSTGGDVTPGGALWITPQSAGPPPNGVNCMVENHNGTQYFIYGTAELYDIAYFAPQDCPVSIEGGAGGAFVGWGYLPGNTDVLTLLGNGKPFEGGVDLWTLIIGGGANIELTGDVPAFPITFPLSARILTCTNTTPGCPAP